MPASAATSFAKRLHHVAARATPPSRGEYVAYRGAFYPVSTKTGYPLSVVADVAANQLNKVVIVPGSDHIYTFLSGASRQARFEGRFEDMGEQERDAFCNSLLRLTLMSDYHDVVVVGDIPGLKGAFQFEAVQLEDMRLPEVIKPSRSWMMVGSAFSIVALAIAASSYITKQAESSLSFASQELAAAEKQLGTVFAEVKAGREKLATTPAAAQTSASAPGSEPLPALSQSFVTDLRAAKRPATNITRVENGILQY